MGCGLSDHPGLEGWGEVCPFPHDLPAYGRGTSRVPAGPERP